MLCPCAVAVAARRRVPTVVAAAFFAILTTSHLYAQTATATLNGTVSDESGAAIPDVVLTLVNADTLVERQSKTNSQGAYAFPFALPGRYTLLAQRDGFAGAQANDIVLNVADNVTIRLTLKVGTVTDSVSVVAEARGTASSGAVATVVDRQFVANQPLNGRSFQTLIGLAPGVIFTPAGVTTQGQFSVNGQRANANYFTIDGVSANFGSATSTSLYETSGGGVPSLSSQGGTNALASVDSVQEFQIQTSTYAPEFGRQPGGQVSIVTRSGTNQYRGTAFEFFRDEALDATDWFANRNNLPKAEVRQHDFGGVLGGPVIRNRAFFFFSYEGLRLEQPVVSSPEQVATVAARARAVGTVRDILNAFPLPNGGESAADPNTATFVGSFSNPSSLDSTSLRADLQLGSRATLFGRYQYAPSDTRTRAANAGSASSVAITSQNTQSVTSGVTVTLSPRWIGDVRVNFARSSALVENIADTFGGASVPSESTFFPSFTGPSRGLSLLAVGPNTVRLGLSQENTQRQFNVVGGMSHIRGSHTIKLGVDYRRLTPVANQGEYTRLLNFAGVTQALAEQLSQVLVARADIDLFPIYNNFSLFAQDTWQASSRFTVTYGARYELNPAPSDANGNLPLTVTGVDSDTIALKPAGARFYDTTYGNVAPRVGATYALDEGGRTILRGGVGLFYDLGYAFTGSALAPSNFPYGNTVTRANVPLSSPFVSEPAPEAIVQAPYPALYAYETDYALPYTWQWNAGLERQVGGSSTASVSYVGALGRRLGRAEVLLNPSPSFTRLNVVRNQGESDYHALQVQFQRRYSAGLQALASYTLAKSMDNISDESISNFQAALDRYNPDMDRGPSAFDIRHSVSAAVSYDLPSPSDGVARAVLGGFGVDLNYRARSALPVNVVIGSDVLGVGTATVARPDVVAGEPFYVDNPNAPGGRQINRLAFSTATGSRQGTLSRNALRGFAFQQMDLSVRRRFRIVKQSTLQLRLDAFNVFNWPSFANPEGRLNNVNFGLSTQMLGRGLGSGGVGLSPLYQVGGPRSLQLSMRLEL